MNETIYIGTIAILTVISIFLLWRVIYYHNKYKDIESIDKEKRRLEKDINELEIDYKQKNRSFKIEEDKLKEKIEEIRLDYRKKKEIYDKLLREIAIYNEEIEYAEFGFYEPHFDFDTPEEYKDEIKKVREEQKMMLKSKLAIYSLTTWTVDNSIKKGETLINRAIRLTARAFNNECDVAIANVNWNNIKRMEERIKKAYEIISKLNKSNHIEISEEYLELKLKELRLTYEYKLKKQQQKEEQAEIKRRMREEAKLQQDMEKAKKEEDRYQKLLEKAKKEAEKATGIKLSKLQEEMEKLQKELEVAKEKAQRAKSMAEQTKAGYIYVISNIGSFGENVYKIGMTRRLEPMERVRELGSASVPFTFDVHAMIYSDNAPALENRLHKIFDDKRVNLANKRKEFFNVSLDEIEKTVKEINPNVDFIQTAEAKEYRETLAIRAIQENKNSIKTDYPAEI